MASGELVEETLRSVIISLKRGDCWCEMSVGNPMVQSHSPACLAAQKVVVN